MAESQFLNSLSSDPNTAQLVEIISTVMELPEESLQDTTKESLMGMFTGAFTPQVQQNAINEVINFFENNNYSRAKATEFIISMKNEFNELIKSLAPSQNKKDILENLFNNITSMYDKALEKYHSTSIVLNMTLDEGAREPTYAHFTDAAADLYAADTVTLEPHSLGNMIRTGVHIQLPEGWMAIIVPRSSIGSKTPLRLSNSVGIIDNHYTGALGVLYDNIGNEPYTIQAGDRIAQLIVMPSYRFKANIVTKLEETERGQEGFGSTGK